MTAVNVTEPRHRLPDDLKQAQQGEEIAVTLHGKVIARIVPDHRESEREAACARLGALRGGVIVGDILAPLDEAWIGDVDPL